jgi:uncharacterized membrane protein
MSQHPLLSSELAQAFQLEIEKFEKKTSCEIRIHLEEQNSAAVLDRAAFVFDHLGMCRTQQRNALLLYIQLYPSELAIIGDIGLQAHITPKDWENWKNNLIQHFAKREFQQGVATTLDQMANHLAPIFPWTADDVNELSNTISR